MSRTRKDRDFRNMRVLGKKLPCRRSQILSTEDQEIWDEYLKLENKYPNVNGFKLERRHSAAHRKSAMKTKKRCQRAEKRGKRNHDDSFN